ncbi:MAG: hypothetical protein JXJ04_24690 [Spirochaetales bacterium]|nr:hypothetical protein [Spirochaetales bacterium]
MKKAIIFYLFICIILSSPLFGIDFGGYLDNTTSFSTDENTGYYQIDRLRLWLTGTLGKDWTYSMMGNYSFELDYPYLFDIDELVLKGKWAFIENGPALFSTGLGRFTISEFSRLVLNHRADGFQFDFNYPGTIISLAMGYTGLLSKHSSTITLSKADTNDQDDTSILFGTPRLLGVLQFHFPEVFSGQDLYLSALIQKDLRSNENILKEGEENFSLAENSGGYYDSIYSGIGLSGAVNSSLYYNVFGYFQTGRTLSYLEDDDAIGGYSYQYVPIIAFLGGTEINYYSPDLSYSTFSLSFIFSSGDEDSISCVEGNTEGSSFLFTPISEQKERVIFNPKLSNIFYIKGRYTIKPFAMLPLSFLENILLILDGTAFFRATTGAITDQKGLNPDSEDLYLGTEIDFIINYRPFSDLGLSLSTGYFIPNNEPGGAFIKDIRSFEFLGKFEFSFSF